MSAICLWMSAIHYEQIRSTKSYTCTYCMVCTVFCTQVSISAKLMGRTLPRHFSDHIDVTYVGIGARVVNQLLCTQKMTRSTVINCMLNINIFICLQANIQQIHYHCNIKLRYIISQYPFTCIITDAYTMLLHFQYFNPLRAKFFRGIINIYSHFISLLHIDMTQVLKIRPHVRRGPAYIT